jgi:hypothetical protein
MVKLKRTGTLGEGGKRIFKSVQALNFLYFKARGISLINS